MLESEQIAKQIEAASGELLPGALKRLRADHAAAVKREEATAKAEPAEVAQLRAQLAALTALEADAAEGSESKATLAAAIGTIGEEIKALLP
jgi:hypothetical protein